MCFLSKFYFFDDLPINLNPAKELGWITILITRNQNDLENPYYNSWIEKILPFDSNQLCLEEFGSSSSIDLIEPYEINEFLFIQITIIKFLFEYTINN